MLKKHTNLERWSLTVFVFGVVFVALGELALAFLPIRLPPAFTKERFATRSYSGVPPVAVSIINWQLNNCLTQTQGSDVLFLGDSSCLMGVMPSVVEHETGLRCWNLGMLGFLGTKGQALVLEQWLKRFGPPRLLVIHVVPFSLWLSDAECNYFQPIREWLAVGSKQDWYDRLPSSVARGYLLGWLSKFASQYDRQSNDMETARGIWPSDKALAKILLDNRGFMPECQATKPRKEWTLEEFRPVNQDSLDGLREIFRLSSEYHFPVYFRMHSLPDVYVNATTQKVYAEYETAVTDAARGFSQVRIARPFLTFMPTEQCVDRHHLSPEGAIVHSQALAKEIAGLVGDRSLLVSKEREFERR